MFSTHKNALSICQIHPSALTRGPNYNVYEWLGPIRVISPLSPAPCFPCIKTYIKIVLTYHFLSTKKALIKPIFKPKTENFPSDTPKARTRTEHTRFVYMQFVVEKIDRQTQKTTRNHAYGWGDRPRERVTTTEEK